MQGGENECRGAAHGSTGDEDAIHTMPLLHLRDDLEHVSLGCGSHPGRFGAVIGRNEDQTVLRSDIAQAAALAAHVANELPAVRTMTVERDEHVVRLFVLKTGR